MNKTITTALLIGASMSSLLFSTAPAFATPDEDKKQTICHATGSKTHPFEEITISVNAIDAHFKDGHQRGEDTFGPCPAVQGTPDRVVPVTPAPTETPFPSEPAVTVPKPTTPNTGTIVNPPADNLENYPAPSSVPNTVNGTPPASAQPVPPAPAQDADTAPTALANTGATDGLILWAVVGLLALAAGIFSVIRVRRNA